MLRASSDQAGERTDLRGITDAAAAADTGVPHGGALLAFADAIVDRDEAAITATREVVLEALGPEATIDAAAVASNFERMVRIADGTGIPLDRPIEMMTAGLRREIGVEDFASAENTRRKSGVVGRTFGRLLFPIARRAIAFVGRRGRTELS